MTESITCTFCSKHANDLSPDVGTMCGRPATQIIYWRDGRWSLACKRHGYSVLNQMAKKLVLRVKDLGIA